MGDETALLIILLVIVIFFFPPLAVGLLAGCGADLFLNIILTILLIFPGQLHALYIMYVYYSRKDVYHDGRGAPGIFSDNVRNGRRRHTVQDHVHDRAAPPAAPPAALPAAYKAHDAPVEQVVHVEKGHGVPPEYH